MLKVAPVTSRKIAGVQFQVGGTLESASAFATSEAARTGLRYAIWQDGKTLQVVYPTFTARGNPARSAHALARRIRADLN